MEHLKLNESNSVVRFRMTGQPAMRTIKLSKVVGRSLDKTSVSILEVPVFDLSDKKEKTLHVPSSLARQVYPIVAGFKSKIKSGKIRGFGEFLGVRRPRYIYDIITGRGVIQIERKNDHPSKHPTHTNYQVTYVGLDGTRNDLIDMTRAA